MFPGTLIELSDQGRLTILKTISKRKVLQNISTKIWQGDKGCQCMISVLENS